MEGQPNSILVVMTEEGAVIEQQEAAVVIEKKPDAKGSLSCFVMRKK